jgi:NAD(P)-dependent dehydrogenase (short-subunit alcohol dehydrogenase family)
MAGSLQGKVAFITGAARGQGRSHALRLAREGADVRDRGRLIAAVDAGVAELGRLDVVVANAGISPLGAQHGSRAWFDAVSVDLVGVINTVEAAFAHLSAGASIVCTGSMAAMMPSGVGSGGGGGAGYAFAKREVARFVHDLAGELAPQSIRVNAVHPGNIDTPMLQNDMMYRMFRPDLENPTREDAAPGFASMHRMPVSTLDPNDISEAVLFLASDASRYVTGLQLKVEAGALLAVSTAGAPG